MEPETKEERRRRQCLEATRRYRQTHKPKPPTEEQRDAAKRAQERYRNRHRTKINMKRREAYYADREAASIRWKQWAENNKDKLRAKALRWRTNNPGRTTELSREWRKKNRGRYNEIKAFRRAAMKRATPAWVDREALRKIYENCPPGYHVDHIIPIVHPLVCGLHVPWNLQYLSAEENRKKRNRIPCDI